MNGNVEAPTGMVAGTVVAEGAEFYWEAVGQGRPIVLLHGLWASSRFFRRQLSAFGQKHRAIAIDLRGHGRSSMTDSGHTVPQLARDLHACLTALNIDGAVLVGWSMGAFVAWDYHLQFNSERIDGMVVVDQAPTDFRYEGMPDALVGVEELRTWTAEILTNRNRFMEVVLPLMFSTPPSPVDADWMCAEMCRAPAAIAASIFVDQCLRDYRSMIPTYELPTLICSGAKSAQPASAARFLAETLPRGELKIFTESGHALFWEEPQKFNREVLQFVDRLAGVPTNEL